MCDYWFSFLTDGAGDLVPIEELGECSIKGEGSSGGRETGVWPSLGISLPQKHQL